MAVDMGEGHYTAEGIRTAVEADRERLFAPWAVGRPEGWTCDPRTRDLVCISYWLREELRRIGVDDLGCRTLEGEFGRRGRSEEDLFGIAAQLMARALVDDIDRNRRIHRRWG